MSRWFWAIALMVGGAIGALSMLAFDRGSDQARVEATVHDYLLAHPEIIPEAMQKLQERETGARVVATGPAIARPFAGAWTGNPRGDVTLVEYYDYNCSYCRASLPVLKQLTAHDPGLRIVYRELPILAENSRTAARMSLAAAAQDRFATFHDALYAGGRVSDATIAAAARAAGVDTAAAAAFVPKADAEIGRNLESAARLGVTGTPSWVVGNRMLSGAMPIEELQRAIAAARTK